MKSLRANLIKKKDVSVNTAPNEEDAPIFLVDNKEYYRKVITISVEEQREGFPTSSKTTKKTIETFKNIGARDNQVVTPPKGHAEKRKSTSTKHSLFIQFARPLHSKMAAEKFAAAIAAKKERGHDVSWFLNKKPKLGQESPAKRSQSSKQSEQGVQPNNSAPATQTNNSMTIAPITSNNNNDNPPSKTTNEAKSGEPAKTLPPIPSAPNTKQSDQQVKEDDVFAGLLDDEDDLFPMDFYAPSQDNTDSNQFFAPNSSFNPWQAFM